MENVLLIISLHPLPPSPTPHPPLRQEFMFSLSGEMMTTRLRRMTFSAMLKQEMAWFDDSKNSVGALCSRLSGGAADVQGVSCNMYRLYSL